ncbi:MAG: hypothetical protein PVH03_08985 [Chloroflexota bacterium]|jgi:hypothetical protein
MKYNNLRLFAFVLAICLGLLLGANQAELVSAVPALQANLLQNPGFEEPYSGGTAQNWSPWHQELNSNPKPDNCSDRYLVRPKWESELASGGLIMEGARSQHVGNNFDTWRGGVMQTVNVNPGSTYRFTFYATGRAAEDQYPAPSDQSVNLSVRGGIDPNGTGVWSDGDIVWGPAGSPHMSGSQGNWQQFSVEATATGGQVTVFVQSDNGGANQCRRHLDVWFDNAQLIEAGPPPTNTRPPQPTSPPRPANTNTPVPPTETPTPEVTPTDTPIPTDTPTNTPEPPQGGIICANAFADTNGNGQHDEDEGYMAGVTFTVAQEEAVVAQGVSLGSETPVCFEGLEEGTYLVGQQVPRNLEMTTAPTATVDLTAGSIISLEFGSRVMTESDEDEISAITPTGEPAAPDEGSTEGNNSLSPLAIVGLGAIILAIILLAALIFILLRQQSATSE